MRNSVLIVCVFFSCFAAAADAQPHGTDVFAANIRSGGGGLIGDILQVQPNGTFTTPIASTNFGTFFPNMVMMDNDNQQLVVLEVNFAATDRLAVWDVPNAKQVSTLEGPTGGSMNWFDTSGDGNFYAVGSNAVYKIDRQGTGFTTLATISGTPASNFHSASYDLATGGIAVGDLGGSRVHLIAPDGTLVTTWTLPAAPFSMAQDHRDGQFVIGTGGSGRVYRIDPVSGLNTVTASAGTNANAITFDRWSGNGEIVVGSNPILRMTTGGVVVTTHTGIPAIANAGMCFNEGRNLTCVQTGPGNVYQYNVHIPSQASKQFAIGLSVTGFTPGIPVDSRVVQLTPDTFTFLSVGGSLPFFTGNTGALDAFGRATATLNLGFLSIPGLKIWAVAGTVDGSAPSKIGVITKPILTLLD